MPRINQEQLEKLIENSNLSEEEMKTLKIIKSEKRLICVSLNSWEFQQYHQYCFTHDSSKSEVSRKILISNLANSKKIYQRKWGKPQKRKTHTFLVPIDLKKDLKTLLKKHQIKEELTESEFMRRGILLFLEEKEDKN